MKDNKYYIPGLEDLRSDYKCEIEYLPGKWSEEALQGLYTDRDGQGAWEFQNSLMEGKLRTKYLDDKDIESDGWKSATSDGYAHRGYLKYFRKDKGRWFVDLMLCEDNKTWIIRRYNLGEDQLYMGPIPSINELRYIQKLLGI